MALLRLDEPIADLVAIGACLRKAPREGADFETAGYPRLDRRAPSKQDFCGTVLAAEPGSDGFPAHLSLDCALHPQRREEWGGLSGAPVFVGRTIVGVVRRVLPWDAKGRRIHAVPLDRLLRDPRFRELVGLPPLDAAESSLRAGGAFGQDPWAQV